MSKKRTFNYCIKHSELCEFSDISDTNCSLTACAKYIPVKFIEDKIKEFETDDPCSISIHQICYRELLKAWKRKK